jgi:hypothetical protein
MEKRILDTREQVIYWLEDGRIKGWLPKPPLRTPQQIEFGLITNGTAILNRTRNHTYIHKEYDRHPGKESVSFSRFIILTNMFWGFRSMKLHIFTKTRGVIKVEMSVKDWMSLAYDRKHPSGYFETQSDVLVDDLVKWISVAYSSKR